MGKHLWSESEDELVEVNCPSCMRGIIHALDWHNSVKKMLPHKKHNGPKHTKGKQYIFPQCLFLSSSFLAGTLAVLSTVEFAYAIYFCNHSSRNIHNPTIHQGLLIASF
ncbi:unnamed protein product [Camellia sinensis]